MASKRELIAPRGDKRYMALQLRSGYALPASQHQRHVLTLIDGDLSP